MTGITPYLQKALLDWCTGAAAVTQPTQRWVQWATQSPTTQSAFDGPFRSRITVTFAGANSPDGSVTNLNAMTGTATAIGTAVGWNLYDRSSGGTRLAFGTLAASVGCASADNPCFSAGALKITLL